MKLKTAVSEVKKCDVLALRRFFRKMYLEVMRWATFKACGNSKLLENNKVSVNFEFF